MRAPSDLVNALRAEHNSLLQRIDFDDHAPPEAVEQIDEFVMRLRLAGFQVDDTKERTLLSGYLRIWGAYLYGFRGGQCPFAEILPFVSREASIAAGSDTLVGRSEIGKSRSLQQTETTFRDNARAGIVHAGVGDINFNIGALVNFVLGNPDVPADIGRRLQDELAGLESMPVANEVSGLYVMILFIHDLFNGILPIDEARMKLLRYGYGLDKFNRVNNIVEEARKVQATASPPQVSE